MFLWYIGVQDDCKSLEIIDRGTWEGLLKRHRDMVGGVALLSGLRALFGMILYRFPTIVELTGLGPLLDTLVIQLK